MDQKSCNKSTALLRKLSFLKRNSEKQKAYSHGVEIKLWKKELELYASNYTLYNQTNEINALKERIDALESARSLQLARKIKKLIGNKSGLGAARNQGEGAQAPIFNIDKNYETLLARVDSINKDPTKTDFQNLWIRQIPQKQDIEDYKRELQRKQDMPKISIIMPVYNIHGDWLRRAIMSVLEQLYQEWELCIVDDASTNADTLKVLKQLAPLDKRINIHYQKKNQGISETSNHALSMATGAYIAFLDHDDCLSPNALLEMYNIIKSENADFIYSDEAIMDPRNNIINAYLKPDFSPDYLLSMNYINHLTVLKKSLIDQCRGFRSGIDGAQDYDLVLKASENAKKIRHIPKILYFWRISTGTFSATDTNKERVHDAGRRVIEYALERRGVEANVYQAKRIYNYRVKRAILQKPKVSIIIPFRDKFEVLEKCLESVLFNTRYENFEVIGIDNESSRIETLEGMRCFENMDHRIKFYPYKGPFNYSKINNYAVTKSTGEHIVLMNSDIEVVNEDWLETLLEHSQREEVGAVGGKLYYPNNTIQHAGVVVGIRRVAGHSYRHAVMDTDGIMNRLCTIVNVSAVTAALMMIKKELYNEVGGLDEVNFQIALNDVDLCLKLLEKGYWNIYTPYCEAYHYESETRGYDTTVEKLQKFEHERYLFMQKWEKYIKGDPFYNENCTLEREDFSLKTDIELQTSVEPLAR